jgi:hypothetical protein
MISEIDRMILAIATNVQWLYFAALATFALCAVLANVWAARQGDTND